jgi:DNA-binding beta-propeller fold protein YncE
LNNLFVCNGYSDNISIVDINSFKKVGGISLKKDENDRIGPHGICIYNNKLLIANNYSNSLCIIDIENKIIEKDFFVGMNCNDVKVVNDNAYVVCGDLNNIIKYDIKENEIKEEIPCGNMPHSIDIHEALNSIVVSNMNSDSITFFKYKDTNFISNIRVGEYPTKALFSEDGSLILVCESNIGSDKCGNISIISSKDLRILHKIAVGNSPVDMFIEKNLCFVSNFGDGSISIIDLSRFMEVSRIKVGGMPRGIVKHKENIYIGDNYNNLLLCINFSNYTKKAIFIGKEPTAMLLF